MQFERETTDGGPIVTTSYIKSTPGIVLNAYELEAQVDSAIDCFNGLAETFQRGSSSWVVRNITNLVVHTAQYDSVEEVRTYAPQNGSQEACYCKYKKTTIYTFCTLS